MTRKNNQEIIRIEDRIEEDLKSCLCNEDQIKYVINRINGESAYIKNAILSGIFILIPLLDYLIDRKLNFGTSFLSLSIAASINLFNIKRYDRYFDKVHPDLHMTADYQGRVLSGEIKQEDIPQKYGLDILVDQL